MKKITLFTTIFALLVSMLTLTACGKSEFALTESTPKRMTVTAAKASKDAAFLSGSLEVGSGELIAMSADLTKGTVRVEIVPTAEEQSIDELPDLNAEAILTANLHSTDQTSGTVPAGRYMLRATCLEKATGTVLIEVLPDPAASRRQDGERFEDTILIEGMEEPVRYEHIRNEALGFEMDYDYEMFTRVSEPDRERFISVYEAPADPWNYLEITRSADSAESVAAAICEELSKEYDLLTEAHTLDHAGACTYIEASVLKGTDMMADRLQLVTVIPSADGCLIATEHLSIESSEGFGRRFSAMLNTLSVF